MDPSLFASDALVLGVIIEAIGQNGYTWISQSTIASELQLSDRTVRSSLARLCNRKYLTAQNRKKHHNTVYTANASPAMDSAHSEENDSAQEQDIDLPSPETASAQDSAVDRKQIPPSPETVSMLTGNGLQTRHIDGTTELTTELTTEGRGLFPVGETEPKPKAKNDPAGFVEFWSAYPPNRRTARPKCVKIWTREKLEQDTGQILAGLASWKLSDLWLKQNGQFIMGPERWLNERKWETPPVTQAHVTEKPLEFVKRKAALREAQKREELP